MPSPQLPDARDLKELTPALADAPFWVQEELRQIFDNAHVGILLLCQRRIVKCNRWVADMFGFADPDELYGMKTVRFYPSEGQFEAVGREAYGQLAQKGYASFETPMLRRDGSTIWVVQSGRTLNPENVLDAPSIWVYTEVTPYKQAEIALRQSQEKFLKAFDSCPLAASISVIADGRFLEVNASYERNFGWSREDLVGKTSLEIGFWPDLAARQRWLDAIRRVGRLVDYETFWTHKSGQRRHVSLSCEIVELEGRDCILTYLTDITARKRAEGDLRIAAAAFESQESMIVTDAQGRILRVNRAFVESTGYCDEELIGQTPRILRSGKHDPAFYRQMWQCINETGSWQGEIWDRRKDGDIYPKWLTISAVKNEEGRVTHYIGTHFDITERKQAEEKIRELAFFDQLTHLPNRTLLVDRLRQALVASDRDSTYGALLFIDLDNFKTLNDTLGHDFGDQLLKQVAKRLTAMLRAGDTVARLGGDEFVVVLSGLAQDAAEAASDVEIIAGKILGALKEPYLLEEVLHHSSASIGVTLFKGTGVPVDELTKQADLAMYKSKSSGRNLVRFFDPTLEAAVRARAALEEDLRQALGQQQFELHYQPQIMHPGQLTGAEVLVRWHHPVRGMVSPADFIPLAEESSLILPLGQWVLETACRQLVSWADQPAFHTLTLAVNVSARQFHQADFVDQVLAALRRTGARPELLKLELTESLLVENVDDIIGKMEALREIGVGFSLDDFGTGYSSLAYLKKLPFDQLKIDQSFVRDVLLDPSDATIARTIVALAESFELGVIAEGVETEAQLGFLRTIGCLAYQGYLFSRPLPLAAFEAYVNARAEAQGKGVAAVAGSL